MPASEPGPLIAGMAASCCPLRVVGSGAGIRFFSRARACEATIHADIAHCHLYMYWLPTLTCAGECLWAKCCGVGVLGSFPMCYIDPMFHDRLGPSHLLQVCDFTEQAASSLVAWLRRHFVTSCQPWQPRESPSARGFSRNMCYYCFFKKGICITFFLWPACLSISLSLRRHQVAHAEFHATPPTPTGLYVWLILLVHEC